jgi:CTD small phosphatase-like protein 2
VLTQLITKDLRVLGDVDLRSVLIVDNSTSNFINQLPNGIPILPYDGSDPQDNELPKLATYLRWLAKSKSSMLMANSDYFKLYIGYRNSDLHQAFHSMFHTPVC